MKPELFGNIEEQYGELNCSLLSSVRSVFRQERDWTCAIACLRTIMRNKFDEDWLISQCEIQPGPQCSKNLKEYLNKVRMKDGVIFGCDNRYTNVKPVSRLETLMTGYDVMIEIMLNYAHWVVLLGIYKMGDIKKDTVVLYDPYFDAIRTFPLEEIISMWYAAGENTIDHDYVAVLKGGKR